LHCSAITDTNCSLTSGVPEDWKDAMPRAIILALLLTGCAGFPEVDDASRIVAGPAPALLPMDQLLAGSAPVAEARGAALVAQAARLRGGDSP